MTTEDHPRSKPHGPGPAGVGRPWNLKNHWISPSLKFKLSDFENFENRWVLERLLKVIMRVYGHSDSSYWISRSQTVFLVILSFGIHHFLSFWDPYQLIFFGYFRDKNHYLWTANNRKLTPAKVHEWAGKDSKTSISLYSKFIVFDYL